MKKTVGTWIVDGNGFSPTWNISSAKKSVCDVDSIVEAHLIAAAPEMFEVLEEFILCGPNAGQNQDLISLVKRIILKAKGE